MGTHDGHRERKRAQFLEHGLDSFADHEVLELLLFYAIPRKDTNGIAHALMDRFGSLDAVFSAPAEELEKVAGVGSSAAALIKLVPQLYRRSRITADEHPAILHDTASIGAFFLDRFVGESNEVTYVACLDAKGKVITCRRLSEGSVGAAEISVRKVMETALRCNAAAVVLAHNHPSGVALPSREDLLATKQVADALCATGIALLDHIIVADGDFVSMAENGIIQRRSM